MKRRESSGRKDKPSTAASGDRLAPQEIQDVLADTGYSADRRKGTLKEILTALVQEQAGAPTSQRAAMIEKVKKIIDQNQKGEPLAEDVLRSRKD